MSLPIQVALTVGPLACYFYIVGVWQSGRRPRVIPGAVDFAVLALGVSGLMTVGPVGQVLMGLIFGPTPGYLAWGLWLLFLSLWVGVFAFSAARRLVVYNLEPDQLVEAVGFAIEAMPGAKFTQTLGGFEATGERRALHVEGSKLLRVGTVDARGREPEALIRTLQPLLRDRLRGVASGPTRVTWGLFLASWLTMLLPLAIFLATEPKAIAVVRALWIRITGGR
jgi:hypothetical protein